MDVGETQTETDDKGNNVLKVIRGPSCTVEWRCPGYLYGDYVVQYSGYRLGTNDNLGRKSDLSVYFEEEHAVKKVDDKKANPNTEVGGEEQEVKTWSKITGDEVSASASPSEDEV